MSRFPLPTLVASLLLLVSGASVGEDRAPQRRGDPPASGQEKGAASALLAAAVQFLVPGVNVEELGKLARLKELVQLMKQSPHSLNVPFHLLGEVLHATHTENQEKQAELNRCLSQCVGK